MGESTPRIVLIGAGRVASHLAEALRDCGMPPLEVGGRVRCAAMPPDADIYVIAVTDAAIAQVAEEIGNVPGLVLHTAGSVPVDVLPQRRRGVMYPMQTFSRDRKVDMRRVPLFVESDTDIDTLLWLARTLSGNVTMADYRMRCTIHLAAVFCNNFTNRMMAIAEGLLKEKGIPFSAMLPLIDETAAKVHGMSPCKAQTGPALRWDTEVMDTHLRMLEGTAAADIYRIVSGDIHDTAELENTQHDVTQ